MECPVIFKDGEGPDSKFVVENMVWGIIPTYLTNPSANDHYRMFNKRIESLERSEIAPYFKTVLQTKRCVVILDGFYEWKVIAGKKHPHYVTLGENETMKMAGVYEESNIFDPKIYATRFTKSFSIITGDPSSKFAPMHNRMPLLLTDEQVLQWLECPSEQVFSLLNELKSNCTNAALPMNKSINFYPVTPKVTAANYQEADCSVYKSIGQTLSSFFKTPYSPPAKSTSLGSSSDTASNNIKESAGESVHASICADISAAESKECDTTTPIKSELGKRPHSQHSHHSQHSQHSPPRTPVLSQRTPAKRSMFTSPDYANSDEYCDDTHTWQTGLDSESTISIDSPLPKHSKPSTSTNSNTTSVTKPSTGTPTQTKSNTKASTASSKSGASASATKKAAVSPGTRPITSFFARSPTKDNK